MTTENKATGDWRVDLLSKFFVYKLGGKFPDHVGAQNELVEYVEALISNVEAKARAEERALIADKVMVMIDVLNSKKDPQWAIETEDKIEALSDVLALLSDNK